MATHDQREAAILSCETEMIGKPMMMLLGAGLIVAGAFNLTLLLLDNGVRHTVVSVVHFIDP
jgi:hypothetical protein